MSKTIAILAGDGIGPEIMNEAIKVLKKIEEVFGHKFSLQEAKVGGSAWDFYGTHFPPETAKMCRNAKAILFGSVGGPVDQQHFPKWKDCEKNSILALRKELGLTCNLRPVVHMTSEIDILCMRELSEDVYFGPHDTSFVNGEKVARDVMVYHESTVRAISHQAFQFARKRGKKVTSVDKANVLDCSKLWRQVVSEIAAEYPDCTVEHMLVDNCAMQMMRSPHSFDVVLMPNMFGDILSDMASVHSGSLGMLPSASLNKHGKGLYEPAGGSAPDIAGLGIANPIGQILSAALMLKHSFGMDEEHDAIVKAVNKAVSAGYRTKDISTSDQFFSTSEMGDAICQFITQEKEHYYAEIMRHGSLFF